jgi:hypothetical protein
MLDLEDKVWIRSYLEQPETQKLFKGWGKSDIECAKIAIWLRKLILDCEGMNKVDANKDVIRNLMLAMHETGQEINVTEMKEIIEVINCVIDLGA